MHSGKKNCLPIPQWDTSGHICVALSPRLKNLGCLFIPSLANSHLQQLVQESSPCISCCPSATFFVPDQWRVNIFFSGWLKKKTREMRRKSSDKMKAQEGGRNSCFWNVSVVNHLWVSPWDCPNFLLTWKQFTFLQLLWKGPQVGRKDYLPQSRVQSPWKQVTSITILLQRY